MPEVWLFTCGQVSVLGLYRCWGHTDLGGLVCLQGHDNSGPELLLRAMSGPIVLLQLGFVLMFLALVTTGGHRNHTC